MSDKIKYPRAAAMVVAKELCQAMRLVTEELIVAGSLRRRKAEVGDVEMLFIPKWGSVNDPNDMFGKTVPCNFAEMAINSLLINGVVTQRPKSDGSFTWGEQNKLAIHKASGIPVDFFQARPANWWNLLVCRTGSKESNEAICNAAIAKGWKWQPYGAGFEDRHTGRQVYTEESERDVFNAVGLVYKEPWER